MKAGGAAPNIIELPWPPASLSGHNTGHWRALSGIVRKHREWARLATLEAKPTIIQSDDADVLLCVTFFPPNRRGDRINFSNRMKPYFDGIADALGVNDRRFLPVYRYGDPIKGGKIMVEVQ
jgi:hypothetical protein